MTKNPLTALDGLLADYASPRARRLIHLLILLASGVVTIWLAAGENWQEFGFALAAALYAWANKANTNPESMIETEEDYLTDDEDDLDPLGSDEFPETTTA